MWWVLRGGVLARQRVGAWFSRGNNATLSRERASLCTRMPRESAAGEPADHLVVMENIQLFLYTFLVSHYLWSVAFILWLFVSGTPTELTNYGLPH